MASGEMRLMTSGELGWVVRSMTLWFSFVLSWASNAGDRGGWKAWPRLGRGPGGSSLPVEGLLVRVKGLAVRGLNGETSAAPGRLFVFRILPVCLRCLM